ncbi:DUF4236 domain-containing protein [Streptomyces cacaoi]|uniref:DUF4236 domain-containing protein n=1 Tax=Streptomyces cacaoi TaxID=1898 RepID=UPI001E2E6242|nr:DUF4236 domain-containing protein [Streptomyces cacaoi]
MRRPTLRMRPARRRTFRVLPGVRLVLGRRSWEAAWGGRRRGRRTTGSVRRRASSMNLPAPFGRRRGRAVRKRTRSRGGS